ncbi:hypothetical protein HPB49_010350 [Dermacentor silvarum]|uniref:Uncharacterized protein n=1 Tax=Dermacentor silvarum TaxID=543639 RepID=A0ACB8C8U6_DERSI|nr:hypothetical protein HPB49_010350 [Dermacentor silvarum]
MASSSASIGGSSMRKTPEETEGYFAWIEYVQSVAECVNMEEKVRSAVKKTEARKCEYVCQIAEALKEEKRLKSLIAYSKEVKANKDKLLKMNTAGDIGPLRDDLAQQNKEHVDADVVVIRSTEPVNKEKLGSSLSAMAAKGGSLERLALVDAAKAQAKFAKMVLALRASVFSCPLHAYYQPVLRNRISSLKKEIAEDLKALEFLKVAQEVCQDETSDSQYNTALDLESLNLSP